MTKHNNYYCNDCGKIFKKKWHKIKHRREYPDGSCKILKGGDDEKMFKKKAKGKPTAPPVEDEIENVEVDDEEEDELESIEEETEAIKKEIETTKAKRKPPVEEADEELTEEKVKQILINFEQRLQKIEYNLRLIP